MVEIPVWLLWLLGVLAGLIVLALVVLVGVLLWVARGGLWR
jgi:hypothetical protein